ncbi:hypothetical protein J2X69_003608 [Algoriphagus sp. 4150]|uniref:hypothetical protein n=1 Tax=Algoriphagus sp. 4150 TaxID=2817756 RepID=UPI002859D6F9|nr:hypothetical protein [Algoriphagus sp. 4150]MDR7131247.1 hypothetical protein [Algoriphagus sp. 4150]
MLGILANGIIFLHAHRTDSGELITHAHPYSADSDSPDDPGHSHTEQEYKSLEFVSFSEYVPFLVLIEIRPFTGTIKAEQLTKVTGHLSSFIVSQKFGRAPPLSMLF